MDSLSSSARADPKGALQPFIVRSEIAGRLIAYAVLTVCFKLKKSWSRRISSRDPFTFSRECVNRESKNKHQYAPQITHSGQRRSVALRQCFSVTVRRVARFSPLAAATGSGDTGSSSWHTNHHPYYYHLHFKSTSPTLVFALNATRFLQSSASEGIVDCCRCYSPAVARHKVTAPACTSCVAFHLPSFGSSLA